MIELAAALAFTALCAWDVARRSINSRRDTKHAADVAAVSAELDKTNAVVEQLAKDWRVKFDQLEREHKQTRETLNGKLSTQHTRPAGYNR